MKRLTIIFLCLTSLVVLADRRSQLMNQRPPAVGGFPSPPTSTGPSIWVDVLEQVTNGAANNLVVSNKTNYGFMGGYFNTDTVSAFTTNNFYKTNQGGVLAAIGATPSPLTGWRWFTNGIDCNNQSYFQSNNGTLAIRINTKTMDLGGGLEQTGTTAPCPNASYCYVQFVSGTWYFDWGDSSAGGNRISKAAPADGLLTWLNIVYVKSNTIQQIWINGTNWLQGNTQTASLFPTNNAAGPLTLMQNAGTDSSPTNYLTKRILMWRYALTPSEIANLHTWMTAMP